jgi:iron-sulfur cluster repair protein YtfE (RIC family)
MNATKLLKEQHDEVRDLFKRYEKLDGADRDTKLALFREIKKKLEIHAAIEEEIFYPPLRRARHQDAREDVAEAYEEHHLIKTVLRDLSSVDPSREEQFDATMKVLKENVEHHADEEEDDLFSDARKVFSKDQLEDYGQRLESRTRELEDSYASAVVR